MDHNCCCLLPDQRCSLTLQTPARENRVAIIAESPTEAGEELDLPLVGETGLNLCRIFERLKAKDSYRYRFFCLRRALLLNASPQKIDGRLEPLGEGDYKLMLRLLKRAKIVICVGTRAREEYLELQDSEKNPDVEIELCHLGDRGLSNLVKRQHPRDGEDRPLYAPRREILSVIADWIEQCCQNPRSYSIGEFETYYRDAIAGRMKSRWVK